MKLIPLTQGQSVQVDDQMFDYLNQWKWYFRDGYAVRMAHGKPRKTIRMHREILSTPQNMQCDHIDGNTLNNQIDNLRICTNAENQHNSQKRKTNKSGYKGVSWIRREEKWVAQIETNGRGKTLGYFDNPMDAAREYDRVAKKLFGEFARLNFPNEV